MITLEISFIIGSGKENSQREEYKQNPKLGLGYNHHQPQEHGASNISFKKPSTC
jgi:hypothetical protein